MKVGHTRHHERHGHKETGGVGVEFERTGYDERRGDNGHEYGQQVLGGGKECLAQGRTVVESVYQTALGHFGLLGCCIICRSHRPLF